MTIALATAGTGLQIDPRGGRGACHPKSNGSVTTGSHALLTDNAIVVDARIHDDGLEIPGIGADKSHQRKAPRFATFHTGGAKTTTGGAEIDHGETVGVPGQDFLRAAGDTVAATTAKRLEL